MSESKMKPKYILLTSPTLKFSRSTHSNSFNAKSFEMQSSFQKVKQCTQPSFHCPDSKHVVPVQKSIYGKEQRYQSPSSQNTIKHVPSCKETSLCGKDSALVRGLQEVKSELTQCMQATASELKRNSVLKQLNALLMEETRSMEQRQKQCKKRGEKQLKRVQKQEYQLEQFQQKYNEEVARITGLRELVDSARTDRVVYSALFKKIEWEIKHYQNLYRETVMRNELKRLAKQRRREEVNANVLQESGQELQAREESVIKRELKGQKEELGMSQLFVTGLEREERLTTKRDLRRKGERRREQLVEMIAQIEGRIQLVVKAVECGSAKEAVQRYMSLENDNMRLIQLIEEDEFVIQELEGEIERINLERRNSAMTQDRHLTRLQSLPSTRKLRSYRYIRTVCQQKEESPAGLVLELATMAGVKGKGRNLEVVLAQVERRVWEQESVPEEKELNNLQGVQTLLNRMQRYESCDRLLSKEQFEGEYMKEVSRQCRQQKEQKLRR